MPKQQPAQSDNGDGVSATNEQEVEKMLSVADSNSSNQEEAAAPVVSRSSKRLREPTEPTATAASAADTATHGTQDSDTLEPEGKRTRLGRAAKAVLVAKPMDADTDDIHHTRMNIIVDGVLVDATELSPPSPHSQEQEPDDSNSNSAVMENHSKDTAEATTSTYAPAPATTDLHIQQPNESSTTKTEAAAPGESTDSNNTTRWRAHQMAEDYIDLASNLMLYPTSQLGPYGYSLPPSSSTSSQQQQQQQQQRYPLQAVSALGYLKGSFRRPTVIEQWSPYEIAVFEAAVGHYGKDFHAVQKEIGSKSCREVIDFYYIWKKTAHYERWKKTYVPPHLDVSLDDEV
jgi:hypothetical protein